MFGEIFSASAMTALFQVIMIDLVLAGDNAIVIGLAAAGLPAEQRNKVIAIGVIAATVMRIVLAGITTQLLAIVGLMLAGGILLLWVAWKMWREMHHSAHAEDDAASALEGDTHPLQVDLPGEPAPRKTFGQAVWQIIVADLSMSLDNVLAVGGAAREHPWVLIFGLALSIALMAAAATFIARLLQRHRWIAYVGLAVILYVALEMIWRGWWEVAPFATPLADGAMGKLAAFGIGPVGLTAGLAAIAIWVASVLAVRARRQRMNT
jgi:YjbE family integral membrane protein